MNIFAWINCSFSRFQCNPKPHARSRDRRPDAIYPTYLIECKQILLDFLTMRVISLPSEPKLHHPEAESVIYHSLHRLRLIEIPLGVNRCRETMWSFMQAPVSFVSTPQAVQVFSCVFMQLDHRANSQEPRLRRANQRKESVTNSQNHAHRQRTCGKHGSGFSRINFIYSHAWIA